MKIIINEYSDKMKATVKKYIRLQDTKNNFASQVFSTLEEAEEYLAKDSLINQQKNKDGLMTDKDLMYWRNVDYNIFEVIEIETKIKTV